MGRASRAARRAERKSERASRKRERADKVQAKNPRRAARLLARADKLDARAAALNSAVTNGVIRGLFGTVVSKNELGNVTIQATWTFSQEDLASYKSLQLTLAPSSPFRSGGGVIDLDIATHKYSFPPMKNVGYVLKLFGVPPEGQNTMLDRTTVKKT